MSDSEAISGWLFVDQKLQSVMFVFRDGRSDDTGLPWYLLKEPGNVEAFRRDFGFKEIELKGFWRFRVEMSKANLSRWFEIRESVR